MKTNFIGNKPYVFISFTKSDEDDITSLIEAFEKVGVCYAYSDKEGENTEKAINRCCVFVTVMSHEALKDEKFIGEITIAKNANKTAVAAMLDQDIEMPNYVKLQVNRFQNIFVYRHESTESLTDEIKRAYVFKKCIKSNIAFKRTIITIASTLIVAIIGICVYSLPINNDEIPDNEHEDSSYKATEGIQYTIEDGVATVTGYFGSEKDIVIPDTYMNCPVVAIADYAFANSNITSVILPSTITKIGNYSFYYCSALTSVVAYGDNIKIGRLAFSYCSSLKSFVAYGDNYDVDNDAFVNCKISSITHK